MPADVNEQIVKALKSLKPPTRSFGSDNEAGMHPQVANAINKANVDHAHGYGDDRWTFQCIDTFQELFGRNAEVLLCWNGTGANVVALQAITPKYGSIICPSGAHIYVDETGGPERILGAKLIPVPCGDGKLKPEQLAPFLHQIGVQHHAQPSVVSITQSTELGTLYSVEEIKAICHEAHAHGMLVHLDGARIANATAALNVPVRALTFDAGVDVVSFGGTKNGMMFGEAVVLAPQHAGKGAIFLRKQSTQLMSKMRFVSAQFLAMFEKDLWLESAKHANAMAARLDEKTRNIPGVILERATEVNSLFPIVPKAAIEPLQDWVFHYTWDADINQVRWVCSFDTTEKDVDRFAEGIRAACEIALSSDQPN
jgi:threonine aldolase